MKSNIALLRLLDLPVFSNASELAYQMHVRYSLISAFSSHPEWYYRKYQIPKRDGSFRNIRQPRRDLKGIQAWVLRNILDKLSASQYATAYIKGRGISDNVSPHCNNRYFICLDLEDFFPSISIRRVVRIFQLVGYSKAASLALARLCTCYGNLPQGALSNLITAKLDRRIAGYTSRRNIIYTRYADDITLSSNNRVLLCKSLPIILKVIKSEHFRPNRDKLRVLGPRTRCLITGLVKNNSEAKFGIGKKKKRQMRAVMHRSLFGSIKDCTYASEASINGWLNYLKPVDKASYDQMVLYWDHLKQKSGIN